MLQTDRWTTYDSNTTLCTTCDGDYQHPFFAGHNSSYALQCYVKQCNVMQYVVGLFLRVV